MNKFKCSPRSKKFRIPLCPFFWQLSLAGYAQSFVTGEFTPERQMAIQRWLLGRERTCLKDNRLCVSVLQNEPHQYITSNAEFHSESNYISNRYLRFICLWLKNVLWLKNRYTNSYENRIYSILNDLLLNSRIFNEYCGQINKGPQK